MSYERRQELAALNGCNMKNCDKYVGHICTDNRDTVNPIGVSSCPKLWDSIPRKNYKD